MAGHALTRPALAGPVSALLLVGLLAGCSGAPVEAVPGGTPTASATSDPAISDPATSESATSEPAMPEPSGGAATDGPDQLLDPDQQLSLQVAPAPAETAVVAPLPACAYADHPTRHGQLQDWAVTMLDTALMLGADYRPDDLVPVSAAGVRGWGEVRSLVVDDLRAMNDAASAAGAAFAVRSAFRDHETQRSNFERWVARIGETGALTESARAGHSEHQLGTALDLRSAESVTPAWEYPDWGQSAAGAWLRENSWQYGFVLSYPAEQSAVTCYDYESWHFRYVGRETAEQIHASGLTLREHLWRTSESQP